MLETKGRAVIVKDYLMKYRQSKSCNACGRTDNLKRVPIKRGHQEIDELCYCQSCWNQIFNEVFKENKQ